MKTLIFYYSLTGNTKIVVDVLSSMLKADIRALKDKNSRKTIFGKLLCAFDALLAKRAKLVDPDYDISKYDRIIIGTPIWVGRPASAILTLFDNLDLSTKDVILFTTQKGTNPRGALDIMVGYVKIKKGRLSYMFSIQSDTKAHIKKMAKDFAIQISQI